jgi:hypothetical protein
MAGSLGPRNIPKTSTKRRTGRRVRIVRPDIGSDLNDVLIAGAK